MTHWTQKVYSNKNIVHTEESVYCEDYNTLMKQPHALLSGELYCLTTKTFKALCDIKVAAVIFYIQSVFLTTLINIKYPKLFVAQYLTNNEPCDLL